MTSSALRKRELRRRVRAQRQRPVAPGQRLQDAVAIADAAEPLWSGASVAGEREAYSHDAGLDAGHDAGHDGSEAGPAGGAPWCVAAYRSMASEPPTDVLVERALAAGVRVILPEMQADKDLDWRAVAADGSLGPLLGRTAIAAAAVIVVPALALDRLGTRLGQGGGSYDRALARRLPTSTVVAVVNDDEILEQRLPREEHDAPVDAVITPGGGLARC